MVNVAEFLTKQVKVVAIDVEIDRLIVTGVVLQGGWLQDRSMARVERIKRSHEEIRTEGDSGDVSGKFTFVGNSDGTISIKSKANEKYVSAEIDNGGRLVARADTIQAWEKFWLTRRLDGRCMLRSCANRKYVCKSADVGYVAAVADRAVESGLFIIDRA